VTFGALVCWLTAKFSLNEDGSLLAEFSMFILMTFATSFAVALLCLFCAHTEFGSVYNGVGIGRFIFISLILSSDSYACLSLVGFGVHWISPAEESLLRLWSCWLETGAICVSRTSVLPPSVISSSGLGQWLPSFLLN